MDNDGKRAGSPPEAKDGAQDSAGKDGDAQTHAPQSAHGPRAAHGPDSLGPPTGYVMTPEEVKRRKQRNLAIGGLVTGWVVLVFIVTIIRLSGGVAQ